jgi:hypothetical protein
MNKTEEYVVKFWLKKPKEEFVKQHSESVWFSSKGKHKEAEKEILNKYRNDGCKIEIISVTYQ